MTSPASADPARDTADADAALSRELRASLWLLALSVLAPALVAALLTLV